MSNSVIIIILVIAALGVAVGIGWHAPDRVPGEDEAAERNRIDN